MFKPDTDPTHHHVRLPHRLHQAGGDPRPLVIVWLTVHRWQGARVDNRAGAAQVYTKPAAALVLSSSSGSPSTISKEVGSRELHRHRAEAEEQVERRGEDHGAPACLRKCERCSQRRGRGCTFKSGTELMMTASL